VSVTVNVLVMEDSGNERLALPTGGGSTALSNQRQPILKRDTVGAGIPEKILSLNQTRAAKGSSEGKNCVKPTRLSRKERPRWLGTWGTIRNRLDPSLRKKSGNSL